MKEILLKLKSKDNLPILVEILIIFFFIFGFAFGIFQYWWLNAIILVSLFLLMFLRPNWIIVFLVGFSVIELADLFGLRLYQWTTIFAFLILSYRFLLLVRTRRCRTCKYKNTKTGEFFSWVSFYFKSAKLEALKIFKQGVFFFSVLGVLVLSSVLGLINSSNFKYSFKQSLVLIFLVILSSIVYWWVKEKKDGIYYAIRSFIYATLPVGIFAIYQNIAHEVGWESYEVMAARPNALFYEPDWLAMFIVMTFSFLIPMLLNQDLALKKKQDKRETIMEKSRELELSEEEEIAHQARMERIDFFQNLNIKNSVYVLFILIFISSIVLIIATARASWLALFLGVFGFFLFSVTSFLLKRITYKKFLNSILSLVVFVIIFTFSLVLVLSLNLTRFNLKDRVASIFTGEHIITMAEKDGVSFKIDLENIDYYRSMGYRIYEDMTEDVNVESRFTAFSSNWEMVKEHPFLGQGQGSVVANRDFVHNANNIFWEWWISGGILGLAAFLLIILGLILRNLKYLFGREKMISEELSRLAKNEKEDNFDLLNVYNSIVVIGLIVVIVSNFFNSGVFFTPIWIWFGVLYGVFDKMHHN